MPKLLYSFWGHLSDKVGISSADGNATYSIWIIEEFIKRGWEVYCVINRDKFLVLQYGINAFKSFAMKKRFGIFNKITFLDDINKLKDTKFDLILHEWRMKTKDNSLPLGDKNRMPDMDIQNLIIENAQKFSTKLILFDLDYELKKEDEDKSMPWKVIEQGIKPKENHTTIFIPINKEVLNEFATQIPHRNKELVYIGNFYNREKDFNEKIIPYAKKNLGVVNLVGNYMKDSLKDFRENNTEIVFHDRVSFDSFNELYSRAIAIPLLATDEYKARGHMTARIIEALYFGGIPIGFSDFYGIDRWLPQELIVDMNNYEKSMSSVLQHIKGLGFFNRINLRNKLIKHIGEKHDAVKFVDTILEGF